MTRPVLPEAAVQQIVAALSPAGRATSVTELTGGSSAFVHRIDITDADGTRAVVVRRHRDAGFKQQGATTVLKEHELLAVLAHHGIEAPRPLVVDASGALTDPFLVTDFVDGTSDVEDADVDGAIDRMADLLVRLHSLDPDVMSVTGLEPIEDPQEAIGAHLDDGPDGDRVRQALAAGGIAPPANLRVLLHGDFWPGNVLWRNGTVAALIDWEDACIGDPLVDLATGRVELLCMFGEAAAERFTNAYLSASVATGRPIDTSRLALWDAYVSATALATMHNWDITPDELALRRPRTEMFLRRAAAALAGQP